jgi:outer membrane receptor protein involved in Fe transport
VRGLADRYTNVLLNGGRVPSADPERRAVNVDIFPGDLISSLSASKTFTPDQYADGTGGSVNVRTKSVPNGFQFSLGAGISYNTNTTGNENFVTYDGGGAGVFAKDGGQRAIPSFVNREARRSGLPIQERFIRRPSGLPRGAADLAQRYDRLSDSMTDVFGTKREEAPFNYSVDGTIGQDFEWFGRPGGVLLGLTWSRDYQYTEEYVANWLSPGPGATRLLLDRNANNPSVPLNVQRGVDSVLLGGLMTLGYSPADGSDLELTLFYTRNAEDEAIVARSLIPRSLQVQWTEVLHYTQRSLGLMQLAGTHDLPAGRGREPTFSWLASAGRTDQLEPDYRTFTSNFGRFIVDRRPVENVFSQRAQTTSPQFRRIWRELEETSYSFKMDFELPVFQDRDDESAFKFGAFYQWSERLFEQIAISYALGQDDSPDIDGVEVELDYYEQVDPAISWANVFLQSDRTGYHGPANNISPATRPRLRWYPYFQNTPPVVSYQALQVLGAAYFMYEGQLTEDIRMILGARAAITDILVEGGVSSDDDPTSRFQTNRADLSQINLLPALALSWDFFDDMKLRFAASRTLALPTFRELAAINILDPVSGIEFIGNPGLEISNITNYDLRWEWFPRDGEVLAVSAFTKLLDRPIELVLDRDDLGDTALYRNFPKGTVYGLEFEVRKRLDTHSELLRNFSIGGNYSYFISSVLLDPISARRRQAVNLPTTRRLQGQPDYTFNVNLTYDNPDSGLFLGLFYNVTGPQLEFAGQGVNPDVVKRPSPQLDFVLRKQLWENWEFTFRARNMINPEVTEAAFFNGREYPFSSYKEGRSYSMSLKFKW